MTEIMYLLIGVSAGFTLGMVFFDHMFYTPMRKRYQELLEGAMDGWGKAIESQLDVLGKAIGVEIGPDGSVKSPIQIKKNDE